MKRDDPFEPTLGARHLGGGRTRFRVWAPAAEAVALHLVAPEDRLVPLAPEGDGYHAAVVEAAPGARYRYVLDGSLERPDPASRLQPEGVHGPSEVVDLGPPAAGGFPGLALEDYVTYEIHVGAFTPEGTFDAAIPRLDALRDLGVTAVELMPVAAFPGARNWGYDGAYPFAVQATYGGPAGLRRLIEACHARGLAVVMDVVYNHLGPEGTYLASFGPYFTGRYTTPWGSALNVDGAQSPEVRRFLLESARYLIFELGADALRLDAVKHLVDMSALPFLEELGADLHRRAAALGRRVHLIAENDANDARLVLPAAGGGMGLDGLWSEDFHHALHAVVTGERGGYYQDFGLVEHLARAYRDGFVYQGEVSRFRGHRHGRPLGDVDPRRLVVFAQNHDQVGNRAGGERLASLISLAAQKLCAVAVLLSPFAPLLFMGEEYGETAPFHYFVSHGDEALVEAVRRGRRRDLEAFCFAGEPADPQAEETFARSKLAWDQRDEGPHAELLALHRALLRLRREAPALAKGGLGELEVIAFEAQRALYLRRWHAGPEIAAVLVFGAAEVTVAAPLPAGEWRTVLGAAQRGAEGLVLSGESFVVLARGAEELRRETV